MNDTPSFNDQIQVEPLRNSFAKELGKLKQKKFRDEMGIVVIEGFRIIEQILSNGIKPQCLITSVPKFDGNLPFKQQFHGNIWQTTPSHMEQICDTKQPQDWAAIMPCHSPEIKDSAFILYLDNIQDPGNMGTIFRTAAAAGISGIVRSPNCCELFNPKVIRASLGSVFYVPTEVHDTDYIEAFQGTSIAMCMDGSESILDYQPSTQNVLLILGSEADGIRLEIMKSVITRLRIPMPGQMESLNVSVSAGIALFLLTNKIQS